jgi:carboxymethylenebutenolidase
MYRFSERTVPLTIGGVATNAELYEPETGGHHPAVVLLYGSGGLKAAGSMYRWYATAFASKGMVTIICPYFDASHGKQRRNPANTRIWIPAVKDCVTFVSSLPSVDPKRIGMFGFSLGGYLGLCTAPRDLRVSALVDMSGPEPKLTSEDWSRFPPTLIMHGDTDHKVGLSNSRDVDKQLTLAKIPHQFIVYPGQDHGYLGAAATDAHTKTVDFLANQLHAFQKAT